MTITPRFSLTQDNSNVYVKIHVPYIRVVGCTEINIFGTEFHFYCKPYLLQLCFPHKVVNEEGNCDDYTSVDSTNFSSTSCSPSNVQNRVLVEEVEDIEYNDEHPTTSVVEENTFSEVAAKSVSVSLVSKKHQDDNNHHKKVRKATASYDPNDNHGTLLVTLPKQNPGQYFSDLDLITKLLLTKSRDAGNTNSPPSRKEIIQVLDTIDDNNSTNCSVGVEGKETSNHADDAGVEESSDWTTTTTTTTTTSHRYGFLQSYHGIFTDLYESHDGLLELPYNPEQLAFHGSTLQRRDHRLQTEDEKFDIDRFLQDYDLTNDTLEQQDMVYQEAIQMVPHWYRNINLRDDGSPFVPEGDDTTTHPNAVDSMTHLLSALHMRATSQRIESTSPSIAVPDTPSRIVPSCRESVGPNEDDNDTTKDCFFTSQERDTLVQIGVLQRRQCHNPSKPSIITACTDEQCRSAALIGLLDLLFAYCYDHRITGGESSCESAWTITMVSPMLSWLESYHHPLDDANGGSDFVEPIAKVIGYCIRRSLIYPYIRNLDFSINIILEDVIQILLLGRRMILRCLLHIRTILEHTTSNDSCRYYLFNTIFVNDYCIWIQNVNEKYVKEFSHSVRNEVDLLKSQNWASERYLVFTRLGIESILESSSCEEDESTTSGSYSTSSSSSDTESTTSSSDNRTHEDLQ